MIVSQSVSWSVSHDDSQSARQSVGHYISQSWWQSVSLSVCLVNHGASQSDMMLASWSQSIINESVMMSRCQQIMIVSQSVSLSTSQWWYQSVSQSISQSFSQSISHDIRRKVEVTYCLLSYRWRGRSRSTPESTRPLSRSRSVRRKSQRTPLSWCLILTLHSIKLLFGWYCVNDKWIKQSASQSFGRSVT